MIPKREKVQKEIQKAMRDWLEEIAESVGEYQIYLNNKIKNSKEINYSEIDEIFEKFYPIANELDILYRLIKEEKVLSDLNAGNITIEEACRLLDKKRVEVSRLYDIFKKYNW